MVGKPAIITRVVDSMTENLRPTRAEATDVANAVLDGWFAAFLFFWRYLVYWIIYVKLLGFTYDLLGADGILLGAETLRGVYPVEVIKTVGRICSEVSSHIH